MFKTLCAIVAVRAIMILWAGITVAKSFRAEYYQGEWFKASLIASYDFCLGIVSIPLFKAYYASIGSTVNWLKLLADLSITLFIAIACLTAFLRARD